MENTTRRQTFNKESNLLKYTSELVSAYLMRSL